MSRGASAYIPLKIVGNATGLVQDRQNFLLPNDAYPVLQNAYIWREQIKRKDGWQLLGRLQRFFSLASLGTSSASPWSFNIYTLLSITEPNAQINPGSVVIVVGGTITFTDNGQGIFTSVTPGNSGTINYETGAVILITTAGVGTATTVTLGYFPGLPVMGIRQYDLAKTNQQTSIGFDTKYSYIYANGWSEWIPGTTWTGNDIDFFWTTNYWMVAGNRLFWVTNASGINGDPIRYSNGSAWTDFIPQVDATNYLQQCLCILPFRNRLLVFNTLEGTSNTFPLASSTRYTQRIRWSGITDPTIQTGPTGAWRDDIRGLGGFIDIPTNEEIVSVGAVRDNLIIYCSRSTWQLRYTGQSIAPFQLERVNPELGAEGTFSTIQFDWTFVGIGDKGIVECDSFKSTRIDIKIPDLIFSFNDNIVGGELYSGTERIQAVRNFVKRLAYWTYVDQTGYNYQAIYPNRRLVYNYENDSWAIFTDSITALGTFNSSGNRIWQTSFGTWSEADFTWGFNQGTTPSICAGNQQGFTFLLDQQVSNDPSLYIANITGNAATDAATILNIPTHNLVTGQIIEISGITGTTFQNLNGAIFSVVVPTVMGSGDPNNVALYVYNPKTDSFDLPQVDPSAVYNGGGVVAIRDNFIIQSKKFNYMDDGESIQIGYIDLLFVTTEAGAFTMQMYAKYDDTTPVNLPPANADAVTQQPDTFFNSVVPTYPHTDKLEKSKHWYRVYCPTRSNFLTIVYTLSNSQMIGIEQQSQVQIDAQTLWSRPSGRIVNP